MVNKKGSRLIQLLFVGMVSMASLQGMEQEQENLFKQPPGTKDDNFKIFFKKQEEYHTETHQKRLKKLEEYIQQLVDFAAFFHQQSVCGISFSKESGGKKISKSAICFFLENANGRELPFLGEPDRKQVLNEIFPNWNAFGKAFGFNKWADFTKEFPNLPNPDNNCEKTIKVDFYYTMNPSKLGDKNQVKDCFKNFNLILPDILAASKLKEKIFLETVLTQWISASNRNINNNKQQNKQLEEKNRTETEGTDLVGKHIFNNNLDIIGETITNYFKNYMAIYEREIIRYQNLGLFFDPSGSLEAHFPKILFYLSNRQKLINQKKNIVVPTKDIEFQEFQKKIKSEFDRECNNYTQKDSIQFFYTLKQGVYLTFDEFKKKFHSGYFLKEQQSIVSFFALFYPLFSDDIMDPDLAIEKSLGFDKVFKDVLDIEDWSKILNFKQLAQNFSQKIPKEWHQNPDSVYSKKLRKVQEKLGLSEDFFAHLQIKKEKVQNPPKELPQQSSNQVKGGEQQQFQIQKENKTNREPTSNLLEEKGQDRFEEEKLPINQKKEKEFESYQIQGQQEAQNEKTFLNQINLGLFQQEKLGGFKDQSKTVNQQQPQLYRLVGTDEVIKTYINKKYKGGIKLLIQEELQAICRGAQQLISETKGDFSNVKRLTAIKEDGNPGSDYDIPSFHKGRNYKELSFRVKSKGNTYWPWDGRLYFGIEHETREICIQEIGHL